MSDSKSHKPYRVPASGKPDDLPFTPQPMVDWFSPQELVRAGLKALLSSLFGAYADKREVQAALTHDEGESGLVVGEYADRDDLWIDYVADMGDGFAPTYAVARLVAESELAFEADGGPYTTRRGDLLVLGGDQVYPTANPEEYWNRLYGPYWAALPYLDEEKHTLPGLFAIPGNHDWYDGLTAFSRMLCQPGRWIGAWRTRQRRSYFAIDLGHDWWLWGIDVQLGSEVDQPQIDFFRHVAEEHMEQGSKVVLCTAEPSWVYNELEGEQAYKNLGYFERKIIRRFGHEVAVGLSGDLHTYARYQEKGTRRQRFVAGGGGAYLYPSHDLPKDLELPDGEGGTDHFSQETVYPDLPTSRRLAWGALLFPFRNWRFSTLLAGFYLVYSWIVQSVSKMLGTSPEESSFLKDIATTPPDLGHLGGVIGKFCANLAHSPPAVLVLAVLAGGLYAFADVKKWWQKLLLGGGHALAHILLLLSLMWVFAFLNLSVFGMQDFNSPGHVLLFSVEMVVVGGGLGGAVMGLYLFLANRLFGRHSNEVFLCQSIADHKHFLRLHRDAEGRLRVYPIAIDEVPPWPKGWRFMPGQAAEGKSWFEAEEGSIVERARLIEPPIEISSTPTAAEEETS